MSNSTKAVKNYLAAFNIFEKSLNGEKDTELHKLRKKAIEKFAKQGFPAKNEENWRFTDLTSFISSDFSLPDESDIDNSVLEAIESNLCKDWKGVQLVFVDGIFQATHSQIPELPKGLKISTLSDDNGESTYAVNNDSALSGNVFQLLNTAFMRDGVHIRVSENSNIEFPVHIMSLASKKGTGTFHTVKNVIQVEQNSSLTLVETFVSESSEVYFTNSCTEIELADNSQMEYYKFQDESAAAFHFSNLNLKQSQYSNFRAHSIDFGGRLVRNNILANLLGQNAESTLNGLYLGSGDQHIDNQTVIEHAMPHCDSHELYQGILTDQAQGVFSGMIHVHPDAQKTDAKQSNNCLLLSDEARINAKPQLEIYADDVKCTHGATVGQLNEEEIFYLQSRGISRKKAKQILTYAFAEKIIEHVQLPALKDRIETLFIKKLGDKFQL